jgi:DNA anti-recombination protein RmuC
MIAAALLSGAGCHKKDDSAKAMDKAASSASKAQEDVHDQAKDVASEQKDVNKEQDKLAKEQNDVAKQQGQMNAAQTDLAQARDRYALAAKQRLSNFDTKLTQIEAKADASAKDAAVKLRARRDQIASQLSAIGAQSQQDWDAFKKNVDDSFDKLDKDADDAIKK